MHNIGLFGYGFAAVAYFAFTLLIFAARNNSFSAKWILISAFTSIAAYASAALKIKLGFNLQWVLLFDTLKIAAWAVLILSSNVEEKTVKAMLASVYDRKFLVIYILLTSVFWTASTYFQFTYNFLFLLFIILNLWTLVLLEQLYRNADEKVRWAIWPLIISIASIAIFDFVMYAQATMVESIDFNFWYARGFIAAFVVPFLLIGTRRIRNGSVRIFVSRHVVFYSSMLMIAGLYLLIMALAGYVINYIGGQWGGLVSITFLVLSGIVLVTLLITESLRKKLKVFIAKNFFANKYEYRDEWLDLIEKIETTSAESQYEMATHIMMSKLDANKGAIVKQISQNKITIKYNDGLVLDEELKTELIKISEYCQAYGWIVDIREYTNKPSEYPGLFLNLPVCEVHNLNLIVPINIGKAFYGMFILCSQKNALNWEDRDLIFAVSKQLGNFISLYEVSEQLSEAKQFDAFNRMSAFLVHDLKNVQAQLALITKNAMKHKQNPDFIDDVFETVNSATTRLDKVLTQLRNKQLAETIKKRVNMNSIILQVIEQRNINQPQVINESLEDADLVIELETIHSVLNHLIQNAQEACTPDGYVKVSSKIIHEQLIINIKDNGCGMSEEFINKRLFKPFDTTKGNAGMGIGAFEAKQFIESLGGTLQVSSKLNEGSTFTLAIPLTLVSE